MKSFRTYILFFVLIAFTAFTSSVNSNEYMVKMNFISRFSNFITWKNAPDKSFVLGTFQDNPFDDIDLKKFKAKNLPIEIQTVIDLNQTENLSTIFIPFSFKGNVEQIVKTCIDNNILCISERDGLAEKGVMINLIRKSGKIQFEINKKSVDSSGLKFNSQLFKLAIEVY